jgi:phosphoserine phosphatase
MTYIRPPLDQLPKDIAVDMDGTLLATDTLDEAFLRGLFSQPLLTLRRLPQLLRGRAAFKEAVAPFLAGQEALLPQRTEFIGWLTQQAESGRRLHLVTAADQRTARAVAEHVGLFESVIASEGEQNLKGPVKRDRLLERFPEGFAYAGDSRADLEVWKAADSIVLAGASPGVQASATTLGKPVEAVFPQAKAGFAAWRKALGVGSGYV